MRSTPPLKGLFFGLVGLPNTSREPKLDTCTALLPTNEIGRSLAVSFQRYRSIH
jgi:hypothetical protein